MKDQQQEGVIKFELHFERMPLPDYDFLTSLESWRQRLIPLGLIGGNDPNRYDGLGFGNVSYRIEPGSDSFLISGTQTGHLSEMDASGYSLVTACNPATNSIYAKGEIQPSSEAMTHHAIYQSAPAARAVIHVHSPDIWSRAVELGVAVTDKSIGYGTPEMAEAFKHLIQASAVPDNTISMGGHEDGIITWGETLDEAGMALLGLAERAGISVGNLDE